MSGDLKTVGCTENTRLFVVLQRCVEIAYRSHVEAVVLMSRKDK